MSKLRRPLALVLVACSVAYLLLGAGGALAERLLLFPRPNHASEPRIKGASVLHLPEAPPGVVALYVPPKAGAPTVVHFHGNGEQLSDMTALATAYRMAGVGFFAIEYPGYGLAPGEPSEESICAAAESGIRYLQNQPRTPNSAIVIQGWSLGTGVAVEMARRGFGTRLILMSPYTSIVDLASGVMPLHPTSLLVRDRFDSLAKAPSITLPTLILHGTRDEIIPFELGERLSHAFPNARFEKLEGGAHDIPFREDVVQAIIEFARGR
jgi:pimeloyl-ACP methyl ester carboxylesterase